MRRLIQLMIVLTLAWGAWWWVASTTMTRVIASELENLRAQGWRIEGLEPQITGFPFTLRQSFTDISATDPTGLTYKVPAARLTAMSYWPGHATLDLPAQTLQAIENGTPIYLKFDGATATLRLKPGTALTLETTQVTAGAWQINDARSNLLTAQSLRLNLTQTSDIPNNYTFNIHADALAPGDGMRTVFNVPAGAPLTFDVFEAAGKTTFDRPLDRHLVGNVPALPRALTLERADIAWGDVTLRAKADMTFDPSGTPDGALTATIQNWRVLMDYGVAAGMISERQMVRVSAFLGMFANMSGTPDELTLTLSAADGLLSINGINLGPSPKFFLQ